MGASTSKASLAGSVISRRLTDCKASRFKSFKINIFQSLFMCQMRFLRDLITSSGLDQTQIQSGWKSEHLRHHQKVVAKADREAVLGEISRA